jgi:hypothetical protein
LTEENKPEEYELPAEEVPQKQDETMDLGKDGKFNYTVRMQEEDDAMFNQILDNYGITMDELEEPF